MAARETTRGKEVCYTNNCGREEEPRARNQHHSSQVQRHDCLYVLMYGQQGFYTMLDWADRQLLLAAGKLNPVPVRPGQRECWGIHWSRLNAVESLGLLIGGLTV